MPRKDWLDQYPIIGSLRAYNRTYGLNEEYPKHPAFAHRERRVNRNGGSSRATGLRSEECSSEDTRGSEPSTRSDSPPIYNTGYVEEVPRRNMAMNENTGPYTRASRTYSPPIYNTGYTEEVPGRNMAMNENTGPYTRASRTYSPPIYNTGYAEEVPGRNMAMNENTGPYTRASHSYAPEPTVSPYSARLLSSGYAEEVSAPSTPLSEYHGHREPSGYQHHSEAENPQSHYDRGNSPSYRPTVSPCGAIHCHVPSPYDAAGPYDVPSPCEEREYTGTVLYERSGYSEDRDDSTEQNNDVVVDNSSNDQGESCDCCHEDSMLNDGYADNAYDGHDDGVDVLYDGDGDGDAYDGDAYDGDAYDDGGYDDDDYYCDDNDDY